MVQSHLRSLKHSIKQCYVRHMEGIKEKSLLGSDLEKVSLSSRFL